MVGFYIYVLYLICADVFILFYIYFCFYLNKLKILIFINLIIKNNIIIIF